MIRQARDAVAGKDSVNCAAYNIPLGRSEYVNCVSSCLTARPTINMQLLLATRPHIIYMIPHTRYYTAAVRVAAAVVYIRYPDRTRTKKKVTPLESSHGHHRQARAASALAAHGRCFDPKRAATAPGCRACPSSREHHVGSLVGRDQTQAQGYQQ